MYLGFSANIRNFTAESIAQQDDDGHLPEQHWSLRILLFFVGVPNWAIGETPPIWWFGHGHAAVQTCWWIVTCDVFVLTLRVSGGIHTTSLAISVLVDIYALFATFFLLKTIIFGWWAPDPALDLRQPVPMM